MAFTLDDVVPWGRSYVEYCQMFDLTEADIERRILGCGDGPASFNCTLTARGGQITSVDPLYENSAKELHDQIETTYETIMQEAHKNQDQFVWNEIQSVEEMGRRRMEAMHEFLDDLPSGHAAGRYVTGRLPSLPFGADDFDIALCGHFLFLYTDRLGLDFHIESVFELLRVAAEVRIFPLLDLDARPSRHVDATVRALEERGHHVEIRKVSYEFRKGGNELLTARRATKSD